MKAFVRFTDLDGGPAFVSAWNVLGASRRGQDQTQILVRDSAHAVYVRESPEEVITRVEEHYAGRYSGGVEMVDGPEPESDEEP